jgi:hypothetical protein
MKNKWFIRFFSGNNFSHKVTKTQRKIKPLIISVLESLWLFKQKSHLLFLVIALECRKNQINNEHNSPQNYQ